MRITPNQNNNHTSFGHVYLFQLPKNAFKNPDDLLAVGNTFEKAVKQITGENPKEFDKTVTILEQPGYPLVVAELKKMGKSSLSLLGQSVGIPIRKSLMEDFHSFYVYTKEHKDVVCQLVDKQHIIELVADLLKKFSTLRDNSIESKNPITWATVKINDILSRQIEKVTAGVPVQKFVINNSLELRKALQKMDY